MMKMREILFAYWRAREPRERRALLILAAALGVALAAQSMWSALSERQRLRGQLPRLAAQLAFLRAGAEEWRELAALPERRRGPSDEAMRRSFAAEAQALGLAATWSDTASLRLQGEVEFDQWVRWLGQGQQEHGLRVLRARISATEGGRVMLEAELGLAGEGR